MLVTPLWLTYTTGPYTNREANRDMEEGFYELVDINGDVKFHGDAAQAQAFVDTNPQIEVIY